MAVEIKEIVIRAVISDTQSSDTIDTSDVSGIEKNMVVQECVHQVLKILKKKNHR